MLPVEVRKVVVHQFTLGDVEDPDLFAGEPLLKWQNSEAGQWVMKNSIDLPEWHRSIDANSYGYKYSITAKLKGVDVTYFNLKWGITK